MLAPQKESIFGCSCRLWLLSWRRARIFARSCSLLSKYLPISWKQRKEQSHAQCHVTHRIRIFDKISEHDKVAKSVDIAVPELAVTNQNAKYKILPCLPYLNETKWFFFEFYDVFNRKKRFPILNGPCPGFTKDMSFFGEKKHFKSLIFDPKFHNWDIFYTILSKIEILHLSCNFLTKNLFLQVSCKMMPVLQ